MVVTPFHPCALVPVYNHHQCLAQTLADIRAHGLAIVMVDDGSNDLCKGVMAQLTEQDSAVTLVTRPENGGKGAAIKSGLAAAAKLGFTHALQIDADGQHNSRDIPRFLQLAQQHPGALLAGKPDYDASVPKGRLYGRYLTHVWVWINTLSLDISDSMCGFRVYPLARSSELVAAEPMGDRMDFDIEFMVRWHWRGWPIRQLATKVIYPEQGVSHFHAWRDNKLISWMHTRLFFGMLRRLPSILMHKCRPVAAVGAAQ